MTSTERDSADLGPMLDDARVVITIGTGGVGKTTTAAAFAVEAARRGRRAVVVTIDPARRLADALGLDELSGTPTTIDGPWSGELSALMLDTKGTFDRVIETHAPSPDQAKRILENPLYRNISSTLSGTQEYMAMEQLHELVTSGRFDMIVVDTPPARHAIDFLDAPGTLTRFLDHRVTSAIISPSRGLGRVLNTAAQALLKTIALVVGRSVVDDAVSFFEAFEGMEAGFRSRAAAVDALLGADTTAFVLVASARAETVTEARHASERLAEDGRPVRALILNRLQPRFGTASADLQRRFADVGDNQLRALIDNLIDHTSLVEREDAATAGLVQIVAPAPVARVPLLNDDVHDIDGVALVADRLFPTT